MALDSHHSCDLSTAAARYRPASLASIGFPIGLWLSTIFSCWSAVSWSEEDFFATLNQWTKMASQQGRTLPLAEKQRDILEQQGKQFFALLYPRLSLEGNFTKFGPRDNFESQQLRARNFTLDDTTERVSINLTQPLFTGFKEYFGHRALEQQTLAQEEVIKETKRQLQLGLAQLYLRASSLLEEKKIYTELLKQAAKRTSLLQQRVKMGRNRQTELFQWKMTEAQYRQELLQREQQLLQTQQQLALLLGLSLQEMGTQLQALQSTEKLIPSLQRLIPARARPLELADLSLWPQIARWEHLELAQGWQYRVSQSDWSPTISLLAQYNLQQTPTQGVRDPNWQMTLNATWLFFEGGRNMAAMAEQKHRLRSMQIEREWAQREVQLQYHQLLEELKLLEQEVALQLEMQTLSERSYQQTQREFELGLVNSLEINQVFENYLRGQMGPVQARLRLSAKILERASLDGTLLN